MFFFVLCSGTTGPSRRWTPTRQKVWIWMRSCQSCRLELELLLRRPWGSGIGSTAWAAGSGEGCSMVRRRRRENTGLFYFLVFKSKEATDSFTQLQIPAQFWLPAIGNCWHRDDREFMWSDWKFHRSIWVKLIKFTLTVWSVTEAQCCQTGNKQGSLSETFTFLCDNLLTLQCEGIMLFCDNSHVVVWSYHVKTWNFYSICEGCHIFTW